MDSEQAARENLAAARLSVATAVTLALLKLGAAIVTGSLSIVASLLDSAMDFVSSLVNYVAVRVAGQPADKEHRYGHGKAEGLAGLVQAVVIGFSGGILFIEGLRRLIGGTSVRHADVGIAVMLVSTIASVWITWKLRSTAKRTGSLALKADSLHYASDVWTNLGVLVALILVRVTGHAWIDGVVAAIVAIVVLATAVWVLRRSADELMDRSLPEAEEAALLETIRAHVPETRGIHDVRTRRAGRAVFMDCHVQFDRTLSFVEAHLLSERVRLAIQESRPEVQVVVHADPDPLLPSDLDPEARR